MKLARFAIVALALFAGQAASRSDGTGLAGHRKGMKIRSAILTEMSGKLGGAVGSVCRGGIQTLRKLVIPHNPQSSGQTAMRAFMTTLTAAWVSTLTIAQRANWAALAGATESGIDVYLANNSILLQGGGAKVSAAPVSRHCALAAPTVAAANAATKAVVTWANVTDPWAATQGGVAIGYITKKQTSSRLSRRFPYRKGGSVLRGVGAPAGTMDVNTPDGQALATGDIVYVRVVTADVTGMVSGDYEFRVTVA